MTATVDTGTTAPTISRADFDYLRQLVMKAAALSLEPGKEYLARTRLEPVAREKGFGNVAELIAKLRANPYGELKTAVIDAMTTNETLWFRDSHPFESLKAEILPGLIAARASKRTLRIWCAASSTGQEPYTIAMMIDETFPELAAWNVRITASDVSTSAVARAKAGSYSQMEVSRGLPATYLVKYFTRRGIQYEISPEIRARVAFSVLNLAGPWPQNGKFDLVLVRNVLIYFNQETKAAIVNKAAGLLEPDGVLMLGSTESLLNVKTNFERITHDKTSYYRLGAQMSPTTANSTTPNPNPKTPSREKD